MLLIDLVINHVIETLYVSDKLDIIAIKKYYQSLGNQNSQICWSREGVVMQKTYSIILFIQKSHLQSIQHCIIVNIKKE